MAAFFTRSEPWLLGHRGCVGDFTENTLGAFQQAMDRGAAGIEFDVRFAADGCPVVIHDAELSRITAGRIEASVSQLSATELSRVPLPGQQHVPRLVEVLAWADTRGALLNLEIKGDIAGTGLAEQVVRVLRERPVAPEQLILSTFQWQLAIELQELAPEYPVAFLCESATAEAEDWVSRQHGRQGEWLIHPRVQAVDEGTLRRWRDRGARLGFWTINAPTELQHALRSEPEHVITDFPERIAPLLTAAES